MIFADYNAWVEFLSSGLRMSVPLIFAAWGGVLSERCGVVNIALEGILLMGAFGSGVGAFFLGSPVAGLVIGVLCGMLTGLVLSGLSISLRVNQIVVGIAINILALGLTTYLARLLLETHADSINLAGFHPMAIPLLSSIPVLGPVLFNQDILVYAMYLMAPLLWWFVYHTPWGLSVRAIGEYPAAADSAGIPVTLVRHLCLAGASAICSLGGCYLVLSQVFLFSEGMSAGKGFIALAAVSLGRWNPLGALLAGLLFGVCDALQLTLQFTNPGVPYQIFVVLPYVAAILAMVGLISKTKAPAAIGIPYKRGVKTDQSLM